MYVKDCINDIELAIKLGYPENLRYKLHLRAAQCYLKLGNRKSVVETVLQIHNILNQHNMPNEKKGRYSLHIFKLEKKIICDISLYFLYNQELLKFLERLQRQINDITSRISCMEDNADNTDTTEFSSQPEVAYGENPNFRFASAAIEVKHAPEKGRYVIANRDIKRGQILFVEKAFAVVPLYHVKANICCNCCRSSGDIPVP